tara:strand:+ start:201 stop:521 length:321 start_codon:yes stop_codon:yes gene_type:complete
MLPAHALLVKEKLDQSVWGERIIAAEGNNNVFRPNDRSCANAWMSCACGKIDTHIEREQSSCAPKDRKLYDLGLLFTQQVNGSRAFGAAVTLIKIEKRSIELLRAA